MIRLANENDISVICSIRDQIHELHVKGRPDIYRIPDNPEEFHASLKDSFSQENYRLFVSEKDDTIIGYALVRIVNREESLISQKRCFYFIEEFAIEKSEQRKGYGKELMQFIINTVKANQADSLNLEVWGFNKEAENFYQSFGMATQRTSLELIF